MFNRKSIYALNKKDPNAIVYPDADGNLIRLTRDDFASNEAFMRWKVWSDENFHTEDNSDVAEDKRKISLDDLSEEFLAMPAIDVVIESYHTQAEEQKKAVERVIHLKELLTEIQFRRLWMYYVNGMDTYEIAVMEKSSHQAISKSITGALKKINKFSSPFTKMVAKTPPKR